MDLTKLTLSELTQLAADIRGEFARRAGECISARIGCELFNIPSGGALLYDLPAIGGDRNSTDWYPSLDAANAALRRMAGDRRVTERADGSLYLDYTANGCSNSEAWTRARPTDA